ncbi:TPA: hypothetical protein ACIZEU_002550 [Enterococcus faecium]
MSKKVGKELLSLGLKKEIVKFRNMYREPEFRLIFQLDIVRGLKISFSCLGYLVWLFIARVGWSNAYSFYKLFSGTDRLKESLEVKEALNNLGSIAFSLFIFALFILQVGKIMMSTNDNYIDYLKPFQKGIKTICRQGTVDLSQYLGHILVETVKPFFLLLILQIPVGLDSESSYGFDFGYKILQCS